MVPAFRRSSSRDEHSVSKESSPNNANLSEKGGFKDTFRLRRRYKVPLAAAALQFPLGHRAVCSVIPGAKSPAEMEANMENLKVEIPDELWTDLVDRGLLPKDAKTP